MNYTVFINQNQNQSGQLGQNNYIVGLGDTLSSIAQRYRTSVAALKSANNMTSDSIRVGQVLIIPNAGSWQDDWVNALSNGSLALGAGATISGNNQPVGARIEVPAGSKLKYVATFVTSNVFQAGGLVSRWTTSESQNLVKQRFEQSFGGNVSVLVSSYAGSMEVNFTVNRDWQTVAALRNTCDAIIASARAQIKGKYPADSPEQNGIKGSNLAVTSLGQSIRNSPSDVLQNNSTPGGGLLPDIPQDAWSALFGTLGITTPIAIVGGGLLLILLLRR